MKAIFYFIFSLLVISFTSCTEEEDIEQMIKSNKISFFVERDNNYKGTILTTTNFSKFNVYAYSSPNAMSPTTSLSSYINNLIVTKSTSSWNYTGAYYWPEDGFVQFFAVASDTNAAGVSNWNIIGSTGYPSFSFATNTITANQKDLVVAKNLNKTYSNSPSGVTMDFKHILTRINITYNKATGKTYTMTKIELIGVNTIGKFNFDSISGTWSNLTTPLPIVYWQGSQPFQNTPIVLNENMFIIPQSNLTLRFTFRTNKGITQTQNATVSPSQIGGNIRYNVLITQ